MVPNAPLPRWPLGLLNCTHLNRLTPSSRNSELTPPNFVFLMTDRSMFLRPGPRTLFRAVLPKVPVVSPACWKQAVLNHMSVVGLDRTGSQIWFGRLLVMPVDSMLCD